MSEFECKSGASMPKDVLDNIKELANNLQVLRETVGRPVKITSGWREKSHNAKIKGAAKNSQHIYGRAADIKVSGFTPKQIANIIEKLIKAGKMKQGGLGVYSSWVHYDTRGKKARW